MSKIATLLKNPKVAISAKCRDFHYKYLQFCLSDKIYPHLPDRMAIKVKYESLFDKKPDLKHPKTFNEKLQWLKLHDRNPMYHTLVDKAEVKKWVADKIGEEYIIPTYGVYDSIDAIDFAILPNQFVLKGTHDSASAIICKDKASANVHDIKDKLSKCLKHNQYIYGREWPYKHLKPRIIAEELLGDGLFDLDDYKFFCFDGKVDNMLYCFDRKDGHAKYMFFDRQWNRLFLQKNEPNAAEIVDRPTNYETMIQIAESLSKGLKHVRVDLYNVNGKIYFGEMTFFNSSGFDIEITEDTDRKFGELISIN